MPKAQRKKTRKSERKHGVLFFHVRFAGAYEAEKFSELLLIDGAGRADDEKKRKTYFGDRRTGRPSWPLSCRIDSGTLSGLHGSWRSAPTAQRPPRWSKAGAEQAATGENPVLVACRRADVIVGPGRHCHCGRAARRGHAENGGRRCGCQRRFGF